MVAVSASGLWLAQTPPWVQQRTVPSAIGGRRWSLWGLGLFFCNLGHRWALSHKLFLPDKASTGDWLQKVSRFLFLWRLTRYPRPPSIMSHGGTQDQQVAASSPRPVDRVPVEHIMLGLTVGADDPSFPTVGSAVRGSGLGTFQLDPRSLWWILD